MEFRKNTTFCTFTIILGVLLMSVSMNGFANETLNTSEKLDRSELIRWAFNELNSETMDILPTFYHEDVEFKDPLVHVKSLDSLRLHYEHLYKNVDSISFHFKEEQVAGHVHTLEWDMTMKKKRLNKGKEFTIEGVSIIAFDSSDKVISHYDYFDVGAMVYERLPVVRTVVKFVKKKLSKGIKEE